MTAGTLEVAGQPEVVRKSEPATRHIPELQSIRGLAALVVVFAHPLSFYAPPQWYLPVWFIVNSQAAVTIFFVLSGFVLTRSLISRPIDGRTIASYYVKRIFRIYPALWLMSIAALLYVSLLHYRFPDPYAATWFLERFQADRFSPLHIGASFFGMLAYLSPPVWTIFIEMLASLFLPLAAWLLVRRPWGFMALFGVLAALGIMCSSAHLYYHLDVYLVDFMLGAALTRLPVRPILELGRMVPLKLLAGFAAVLMMLTRCFLTVDPYDFWLAQWEAAMAALIIFVFARAGVVSPILRNPALVRLGDISYSLYIMHFTIMCLIAKAILLFAPDLPLALGGGFLSLVLAALTVPTALVVAAWAYARIELPGIAVGQRVVAWMANWNLYALKGASKADSQNTLIS